MLSCPYCQAQVEEDSPACSSCSLSVEGATTLLGPVPLLNRGLTDTTETLSNRQTRAIKAEISRFEKSHPQSNLNIVLRDFDPAFNLSTHLFWLFNTAGLSPQDLQNEKNQDVLIGLDPVQGRLGLMIGYGLEPFIPKDAIHSLLELARPQLEEGNPSEALTLVTQKLSTLFNNASRTAREALGISG